MNFSVKIKFYNTSRKKLALEYSSAFYLTPLKKMSISGLRTRSVFVSNDLLKGLRVSVELVGDIHDFNSYEDVFDRIQVVAEKKMFANPIGIVEFHWKVAHIADPLKTNRIKTSR